MFFLLDLLEELDLLDLLDVLDLLADTPTADVRENVHGKWLICDIRDYVGRPTGRKLAKCSRCDFLTDDYRQREDLVKHMTHFCPNCGSEMDERREE